MVLLQGVRGSESKSGALIVEVISAGVALGISVGADLNLHFLMKTTVPKCGQSSHKTYSNNILNFQESSIILNACTKKSGNLLKAPCTFVYIYNMCVYIYIGIIRSS